MFSGFRGYCRVQLTRRAKERRTVAVSDADFDANVETAIALTI
jgi:hypothetical protein